MHVSANKHFFQHLLLATCDKEGIYSLAKASWILHWCSHCFSSIPRLVCWGCVIVIFFSCNAILLVTFLLPKSFLCLTFFIYLAFAAIHHYFLGCNNLFHHKGILSYSYHFTVASSLARNSLSTFTSCNAACKCILRFSSLTWSFPHCFCMLYLHQVLNKGYHLFN